MACLFELGLPEDWEVRGAIRHETLYNILKVEVCHGPKTDMTLELNDLLLLSILLIQSNLSNPLHKLSSNIQKARDQKSVYGSTALYVGLLTTELVLNLVWLYWYWKFFYAVLRCSETTRIVAANITALQPILIWCLWAVSGDIDALCKKCIDNFVFVVYRRRHLSTRSFNGESNHVHLSGISC